MNFRIALTEDNGINRNTFLQKIRTLDHWQLVFVATNGRQCLEELHGLPASRLPQVVFMDLEMPEMNGVETIRVAKSLHPSIHFVVLTVFDDEEKIFEAIRAGASGYLLKHETTAVLQEAVTNVIDYGGAPMSPAVARKALQLMSKAALPDIQGEKSTIPSMITSREEEILKYMVKGWDAKRIASELAISVLTVRKHIANVYEKLHVQSKAEIISMAHQQNWFRS